MITMQQKNLQDVTKNKITDFDSEGNRIIYINDNPMTVVQLTIVFLHLMHLVVGILLILLELVYPHYYHFIEVIWLLIGYSIYLN